MEKDCLCLVKYFDGPFGYRNQMPGVNQMPRGAPGLNSYWVMWSPVNNWAPGEEHRSQSLPSVRAAYFYRLTEDGGHQERMTGHVVTLQMQDSGLVTFTF